MPRKCSVCNHPKRKEIDKAILNGTSYRDIAGQYTLSKTSIERHVKSGHIAEKIKKAKEIKDIDEALDFWDKVDEVDTLDRASFLDTHKNGTPREKSEATKTRMSLLMNIGKATNIIVDKQEITASVQVEDVREEIITKLSRRITARAEE